MKYLKCILIGFLLLCFSNFMSVKSQTPIFNDTIEVNESFTYDTTILLSNTQEIFGISVSGHIQFFSDTSLVRIIIADTSGLEYMVYESYPMLDTVWSFSFAQKCEETCFLNGFIFNSFSLQITNATLHLDRFQDATSSVQDATQLQYQVKLSKDNEKIARLNTFLESKGMLWRAGITNFSLMYYQDKFNEESGLARCAYGFDYYKVGIFEIFNKNGTMNDPTYDIVERFDWRERHDANIENTPYYNPGGSGWMTKVNCQDGCLINNEWNCISHPECTNSGGVWIGTGACTGFSAIAVTEGFANLYYNQPINFDLSEQQLASDEMNPPYNNCAGVLMGGNYEAFDVIDDFGVIDEASFPFVGTNVPCDQQQYPPNERVSIGSYLITSAYPGNYTPEDLKRDLMTYGPLQLLQVPPLASNHAITLVGFDVLSAGKQYMTDDDEIFEVPTFSSETDVPYWIFKNSYGAQAGMDGYWCIRLYERPENYVKININEETPLTSINYDEEDILIRDEDNDGYLNWGIGNCEECTGEKDGNDHDASLGPIDENGFCSIINTYNTSFEGNSYDNWKQAGDDSFDWLKHHGATWNPTYGPTGAYDGVNYMLLDGIFLDPEPGDKVYFESPKISFNTVCSVSLDFYFFRHYEDGTPPIFSVETSVDNGSTWDESFSANNWLEDPNWHHVIVELASNINKIRFVGEFGSYPPQQNIGIDNITITPVFQQTPLIITSNTYWSGEIHACDDIIIEENIKLTLNPGCILHMAEGHKIVVKRQADLIVSGTTITNDNEGLWKGIEVWGDNQAPGNSYIQGFVGVSGNSTISNAECVFLATRINETNGDGLPEYSGGIVLVSNSSLINNKKAAWFLPFSGDVAFSKFTNCLIEVNDNIIAGTTVEEFIKLGSIDGVSFTHVTMNDARTNISILNRPTGILAVSSNFNVTGTNNSGVFTTSFSNLCYGIKALGIQVTDNFSVTESAFYNNLRGIYSSATTGSQINLCEFQPWENASPFLENYGLYLDNSTGYQVEENQFINESATRKGNGLVINNSGSDANEVYRNTFTGLNYSILAQNENRSINGLTGLCIKCNDFNECNNDITILTNMQDDDPQLGIAINQGADSPDPTAMSGNLFYIESTKPDGDFDDINNQLQHINYYYPFVNSNSDVKPIDYTTNSVTAFPVSTYPILWTYEDGCPSSFGGGGGGTGGSEEFIQNMAESQQKIDSIQNLLDLLIDAGNTEAMQSEVYNSAPQQTLQLYSELMNASPFVSDTVVSTAIEKEDVFPDAMIRDIMVANPSTAKSERLMTKLDERFNPLPDYMKAQILNGRSLVSIKEETESKLTGWNVKKTRALNNLYRYYMYDTSNNSNSNQLLTSLLLNDNTLQSKYALAFNYLSNGNTQAGEEILNSIPQQFSLSARQLSSNENLIAYYNILADYKYDSLNILQADSTTVAELYEIMEADDALVGSFARNILLALDQLTYVEPVLLPDMFKSAEAFENYNKLIQTTKPQLIKVFPNPSKDYLIIEYKFENTGDMTIEICDLQGIINYTVNKTTLHDQLLIDTRSWESGIYVVSLKQNGALLESCKFSVIK